MIKYNLEFLLKIKTEDIKPIRGYKFIHSKNYFFGIYSTEPKFIGDFKETIYLNKVDANKYIIKNNVIYNKPRVLLCFVNNTVVNYIFFFFF